MGATIRLVTLDDAPEIAAIYSFFVLHTPASFESDAPDAEEIAKRIADISPRYPWLVCEANGQVAGYAYASQHRPRYHYQWSVDVTVYTHENFRRIGIGKALYTALLKMLPLQGFVAAHAGITLPNDGSVGLHEAMGFKQVAIYPNVGYKLGKWHNVGWWQLRLRHAEPDPMQPQLMSDVIDTPTWYEALLSGRMLLKELNQR